MASDTNGRDSAPQGLRDEKLAQVLADCSDRLNAGQSLDRARVIEENPDLLPEIQIALEALTVVEDTVRGQGVEGSLGDFRLIREIGRGGMGIVYESWQASLDRRVALKVLPPALLANKKAVSRFEREAKVAGRLQHPNIVSVYGMGVEAGAPYFAMEYVEGETLDQILGRLLAASSAPVSGPARDPGLESSFSAAEINLKYCLKAAEAFGEVCDGLQYAHQEGVIHRDLKPSNLILDRQGRLRILDFGLAKLEGQESLTLSGDFLGTPLYMSPEQAMAHRVPLDHRTDIYSLGATLYEMLARKPPFRGGDYKETLSQIISRDPPPLRRWNARIPKNLETIVLKCLRKDPSDRYGTAEALAQDLRRFVRGDPIEARPEPILEKLFRRAFQQKWRLLAVASVFLLCLTTGVLVQHSVFESRRRDEGLYRDRVVSAAMKIHLGRPLSRRTGGGTRRTPAEETSRQGGLFEVAFAEEAGPRDPIDPVEEAVSALRGAERLFPRKPDAHYQLARAFSVLGRKEEALSELRRTMECDPGFVPAAALRAAILEKEGQATPVSGTFIASIVRQPEWGEAWLEAHRSLLRNDWTRAAQAYSLLLQREAEGKESYLGSHLDALLGRGRADLEQKDYDRALEDFSAARILGRDLLEPVLLLGKTYFLKGRPERAEEVFEEVLARSRQRDETALRIAGTYLGLREFERGLRWAERASESEAREHLRSNLLVRLDRLVEALRAAERAVELGPEDPRSHEALGYVLFRQGKPDRALEELGRALKLDPRYFLARHSLGQVLEALGKQEEAIREYQEAKRVDPRSSLPARSLGRLYYRAGKMSEAAQEFRLAIEVDPDDAAAHSYLGEVLRQMKKPEDSLAEHRKAIGLEPRQAAFRHNLGLALKTAGDAAGAAGEFRQALEIDPDLLNSHLSLASLLEAQGKIADAVEALKAANRIDPASAARHNQAGKLLASRLRKFPEAIAEYQKALAIDPNHSASLFNLMLALKEAGDIEKAEETGLKALSVLEANRRSRGDDRVFRSTLLHVLEHLSRFSAKAGRAAESRQYTERAIAYQKEFVDRPGASAAEMNQYAWTLLDCEPAELRRPSEALEYARRAAELSNQSDPEILDTLAMAYFQTGDPARASEVEEKAFLLLPQTPPDRRGAELRKVIEEHRARFRAQREER